MNIIKSKTKISTKLLVTSSMLVAISIIFERIFSFMIPIAGLPALRFGFGSVPLFINSIIAGPFIGGLCGIVADFIGFSINSGGGPYFPGFTLSAFLSGFIPGLFYSLVKRKKYKFDFVIINILSIALLFLGTLTILFNNKILSFKNNILYYYDNPINIIVLIIFTLAIIIFISIPLFLRKRNENKENIYSLDKILFAVCLTNIIISLLLNTFWLSIMFNKGFLIFLPGRILSSLVKIPLEALILYTLLNSLKKIIV